MNIKRPDTCKKASSRWSHDSKLEEKFRKHHNASCSGMSESQAVDWRKRHYLPKANFVHIARCESEKLMIAEKYWLGNNPTIKNFILDGVIIWPETLNQDNEGSRKACLLEAMVALRAKGKGMQDLDVEVVQAEMVQAENDAKGETTPWNPQLDDVS